MITLRGAYADTCNGILPDRELHFVCRIIPAICNETRKIVWVNGIGEEVFIHDEDVLQQFCEGGWYALYRENLKEIL